MAAGRDIYDRVCGIVCYGGLWCWCGVHTGEVRYFICYRV